MAISFELGGPRSDPEVAFSFDVYSTDGYIPKDSLSFSEVSGLRATTNTIEYKEGTDTSVRKIPGRSTVENLTLRRGLDTQKILRNWYNLVREDGIILNNGKPATDFRKNLVVQQMARGAAGREEHVIRRWTAHNAWPTALEVSDFRGDADEVTIESLEICYERLDEEIVGTEVLGILSDVSVL